MVTPLRPIVSLSVHFEPAWGETLTEHVLVVEPAREERVQLQRSLETAGYRVSTVDAAEPALLAFQQAPPDAVLLDVVAPGFEAFATCRRLRQLPAGARAAILCLTPGPDSAAQDRALEAGADDCLAKPLHDRELLLKLRSLLRHKQESAEYERIRSQRDALVRAQHLREETIALVVHDMKNPLAGVLSNAEYLVGSKGLNSDQTECARDILSASRRLHRLVMSLLDVNLREHGELTPSLGPVDLSEVVANAVHHAAPSLVDKQLRCTITGHNGPLQLRADRDMMLRLIGNLLDNAVRSSPFKGEIVIALAPQADAIRLEIIDRGGRLPPEYRTQIFEGYVAGDEALRRARKGRGLGLASCRAIVEAHGGTIQVEDAEPQGTQFVVTLPARRLS